MMDNKNSLIERIKKTCSDGRSLLGQMKREERSFNQNYHYWYTEAVAIIKQVLHKRSVEFEKLYINKDYERERV